MGTFTERQGDLFESTAGAYAHGVNTAGVMGAGIAAGFRDRYPDMYELYRAQCTLGGLRPGSVLEWHDPGGDRWIYNVASQDHPGPHARLDWLVDGFADAMDHADIHGVNTIAIPRIGCGIGGLLWTDVRPALAGLFMGRKVNVEVWTP